MINFSAKKLALLAILFGIGFAKLQPSVEVVDQNVAFVGTTDSSVDGKKSEEAKKNTDEFDEYLKKKKGVLAKQGRAKTRTRVILGTIALSVGSLIGYCVFTVCSFFVNFPKSFSEKQAKYSGDPSELQAYNQYVLIYASSRLGRFDFENFSSNDVERVIEVSKKINFKDLGYNSEDEEVLKLLLPATIGSLSFFHPAGVPDLLDGKTDEEVMPIAKAFIPSWLGLKATKSLINAQKKQAEAEMQRIRYDSILRESKLAALGFRKFSLSDIELLSKKNQDKSYFDFNNDDIREAVSDFIIICEKIHVKKAGSLTEADGVKMKAVFDALNKHFEKEFDARRREERAKDADYFKIVDAVDSSLGQSWQKIFTNLSEESLKKVKRKIVLKLHSDKIDNKDLKDHFDVATKDFNVFMQKASEDSAAAKKTGVVSDDQISKIGIALAQHLQWHEEVKKALIDKPDSRGGKPQVLDSIPGGIGAGDGASLADSEKQEAYRISKGNLDSFNRARGCRGNVSKLKNAITAAIENKDANRSTERAAFLKFSGVADSDEGSVKDRELFKAKKRALSDKLEKLSISAVDEALELLKDLINFQCYGDPIP